MQHDKKDKKTPRPSTQISKKQMEAYILRLTDKGSNPSNALSGAELGPQPEMMNPVPPSMNMGEVPPIPGMPMGQPQMGQPQPGPQGINPMMIQPGPEDMPMTEEDQPMFSVMDKLTKLMRS